MTDKVWQGFFCILAIFLGGFVLYALAFPDYDFPGRCIMIILSTIAFFVAAVMVYVSK